MTLPEPAPPDTLKAVDAPPVLGELPPRVPPVARLKRATINSFSGFRFALRNEESFRQETFLFMICIVLGFFVAPSPGWYVAMIGSILIVLMTELLNTAIERLADHVTPEFHPQIGVIKDAGSAAVFCALLLAGTIWLAAVASWLGLI